MHNYFGNKYQVLICVYYYEYSRILHGSYFFTFCLIIIDNEIKLLKVIYQSS